MHKRYKFDVRPGIVSGIVSASKSGEYVDQKPPKLVVQECDLKEFFPEDPCKDENNGGAISNTEADGTGFMNQWKDEKSLEKQVRNDVFVFLKNSDLDIKFPSDTATQDNPSVYREKALKTIFGKGERQT